MTKQGNINLSFVIDDLSKQNNRLAIERATMTAIAHQCKLEKNQLIEEIERFKQENAELKQQIEELKQGAADK